MGKMNPYAVTHDVEFTHETELEAAEAELTSHRIHCDKNPGHQNFIPIKNFCLDHLPPQHRHQELLDYVKIQGELTVRLRVTYTSHGRPERFPVVADMKVNPYYEPGGPYPNKDLAGTTWGRVGTGFVVSVEKGGELRDSVSRASVIDRGELEGPCLCRKNCPERKWARLRICTALHLVYDHKEAEKLTAEFFFDSDQDRRAGRTRKTGAAHVVETSVEADRCTLLSHTHDLDLIHRLFDAGGRWVKLRDDLRKLFSTVEVPPVVIVSHPHGCGKVVTLGEVKEQKGRQWVYKSHPVSTYTAPTCPGSSGAPVLWWGRQEDDEDGKISMHLPFVPSPHSGFVNLSGSNLGRCGQI